MRWFSLSSFVLLTACGASEFQSQKLADGSYTFRCELAMDECVRRAQEKCKNQRYRILEGTSETRLRDAPPFERAYHTSRLHLMCTDDGANVLLSVESKKAEAPKSARTCAVGETRACIGAGACKGGQTCLADGSGFGSCDCGSAATPATPDPAITPAPATTSLPASSADAPVSPPPAAPAPPVAPATPVP
jgi:hypothetical protein